LGVKKGPADCARVDTAGVSQAAVGSSRVVPAIALFISNEAGTAMGNAAPSWISLRRLIEMSFTR